MYSVMSYTYTDSSGNANTLYAPLKSGHAFTYPKGIDAIKPEDYPGGYWMVFGRVSKS